MVARLLGFDRLLNEGREIVVCTAAGHHGVEIMIEVGEEAGADLAIGGKSDTAAGSAKGLRYRSDDANFSDAIIEGIAARSFPRVVSRQAAPGGESW